MIACIFDPTGILEQVTELEANQTRPLELMIQTNPGDRPPTIFVAPLLRSPLPEDHNLPFAVASVTARELQTALRALLEGLSEMQATEAWLVIVPDPTARFAIGNAAFVIGDEQQAKRVERNLSEMVNGTAARPNGTLLIDRYFPQPQNS